MAFAADAGGDRTARLLVSLVTTHLAISKVPRAITPEAVASACYWTTLLARELGAKKPKMLVASLNPHAGEAGLLGDEEITKIRPGIALAEKRLKRAKVDATLVGPIGAETAIRLGARGEADGVVAMYHDQATIPTKLLGFGEAVNVSLGLPIIRTSVDHGTGYDAAWKGKADARGMQHALELAQKLVIAKRTAP
jgi:4-hydroxythreonine-4-phosphate dehydrogenase